MKYKSRLAEKVTNQTVPDINADEGGPGSGQKGHTTAVGKNDAGETTFDGKTAKELGGEWNAKAVPISRHEFAKSRADRAAAARKHGAIAGTGEKSYDPQWDK